MSQTIAEIFELPQPKVYKGKQNPDKCSNDNLLIGLELEVENIHEGLEYYRDRAGSFWSVVEDGSLRPRGAAWEFVSKPTHIGIALAELRILFDKLKFTDGNYSDRCSVHVHTNVLDFTQEQVANLALVYPVFEAVLFRYVNHHKKKEEQGYCRDTNLYCIPWGDCRMNRNFVEHFFDEPHRFVSSRLTGRASKWEKYTALNFVPMGEHGTVEWRHMHGTADMEKLTTWLNLIGSIMKFCKENDFSDIVKTIKILNDVSTYQQFFNAVLAGNLQYLEEYRAPMAEGVINAKYSLVNYEANKGKDKKLLKSSKYARAAQEALVAMDEEFLEDAPGWDAPRPAPEMQMQAQVRAAGVQLNVPGRWDTIMAQGGGDPFARVARPAQPAPRGPDALAERLARITRVPRR